MVIIALALDERRKFKKKQKEDKNLSTEKSAEKIEYTSFNQPLLNKI